MQAPREAEVTEFPGRDRYYRAAPCQNAKAARSRWTTSSWAPVSSGCTPARRPSRCSLPGHQRRVEARVHHAGAPTAASGARTSSSEPSARPADATMISGGLRLRRAPLPAQPATTTPAMQRNSPTSRALTPRRMSVPSPSITMKPEARSFLTCRIPDATQQHAVWGRCG